MKLDIAVEPSFIALGPFHIAVGINDRAWIYEIRENGMIVHTCMMLCTCSAHSTDIRNLQNALHNIYKNSQNARQSRECVNIHV